VYGDVGLAVNGGTAWDWVLDRRERCVRVGKREWQLAQFEFQNEGQIS
jgi:hypothetical protein